VTPNRKRSLGYVITGVLNPVFGDKMLRDITREQVRAWVSDLDARGLRRSTVRSYKTDLVTVLNGAVDLEYLESNRALRVKTKREPPRRLNIITVDEFWDVYAALPGDEARMLAETEIESGTRWGEITELRGRDIVPHGRAGYLDVTRAVNDAGIAVGEPVRYLVEDMTKNGTDHKVTLRTGVWERLREHLETHQIGEDDLVFSHTRIMATVAVERADKRRAATLDRQIPRALVGPGRGAAARPFPTASSPGTSRAGAGASGARWRCPSCTASSSSPPARGRARWPAVTMSATTPSGKASGSRHWRRPASPVRSRSTSSVMPTPPGCSTAAPALWWSRSG
jgi:hypothetical protein